MRPTTLLLYRDRIKNVMANLRRRRLPTKLKAPSVKIPLHISPEDWSIGADRKRYDLHASMMSLNPSGWRRIGKKAKYNHQSNHVTRLAGAYL